MANKISTVSRRRFEGKLHRFENLMKDALIPHKNRRVCKHCRRSKQLFKTEEEALNFIWFNGDKFHHQNDLRVYWCWCCAGYHFSSKPPKPSCKNSERLIAASNHKPVGVYAKICAERIWRNLDWDIRALPQKEFDNYCERKLNVRLTSSVYINGLAKLYKSFHSEA